MNSFPIPLYLILYILFFLSLLKSSSSDGHETKQQVHVSSAKFCSSKISHQGTVIQGFIPSGRVHKYLPDMKQGSVYRLFTFYGFKSKPFLLTKTSSGSIHMRILKLIVTFTLVNGQTFIEHLIIDEVEIATCCVFCGSVMKLYFWDQTVTDFCKKFKSYENIPTVLLVTTDNTKCLRDCNSDRLHILTYVACGIT
ncbi:hypothetical protein DY000_02023673 [Brassica cretica]|uniref:F-box associated domain-containing protein n=1 Tax=Brassica cretica TaxID=69181 RepID=A0ABQ7EFN4_BRACR|nr:hypothetical protein DY000_02023673 [Brassica cretica]